MNWPGWRSGMLVLNRGKDGGRGETRTLKTNGRHILSVVRLPISPLARGLGVLMRTVLDLGGERGCAGLPSQTAEFIILN